MIPTFVLRPKRLFFAVLPIGEHTNQQNRSGLRRLCETGLYHISEFESFTRFPFVYLWRTVEIDLRWPVVSTAASFAVMLSGFKPAANAADIAARSV